MICPCYECQERTPKCHSTCDRYLSFKEENERQKAILKPLKDAERNMVAYKREVYEKYKRRYKVK